MSLCCPGVVSFIAFAACCCNRIGRIEYLDRTKDGALKDVGVIQDMRMVHIPAETLSNGPNGLVTTLKRSDVSKLD